MAKLTFELSESSTAQRNKIRAVYGGLVDFERLDPTCWNVSCNDEDADELTSLLDSLKINYRMV